MASSAASWHMSCSPARLLSAFAGSSIDLAPLLYQPAEYEAEEPPATQAAPSQANQGPSVLDALHSLSQQCHVFKKSAERLGQQLVSGYVAADWTLEITQF